MHPNQAKVESVSAAYKTGPNTNTYTFSVSVPATAGGVSLNTLIVGGIPLVATGNANITRVPNHVMFQLPTAAANPVYYTADGTTAPVVATPVGIELQAGQAHIFENAADLLSKPTSASAFKFIATGATTMTVVFWD